MQKYQLAQFNIARMKAPLDNSLMKEFVDNLLLVNAQAAQAPGFVWRLQTETGYGVEIEAYEDSMFIINMSVWESVTALKEFTYQNADHARMFKKRKHWFDPKSSGLVMWWIPRGYLPSITEGKERLAFLKEKGASPYAFDFREVYNSKS